MLVPLARVSSIASTVQCGWPEVISNNEMDRRFTSSGVMLNRDFFFLQQVFINPKPVSAGLQIEGVDITINGKLNGIPLEPPNPAICVGNGFVMEATNDVRDFPAYVILTLILVI